jgi:hypothetical protein
MIAHLTILWIAAILLFVPPLTCTLGRMKALLPAFTPPTLLSVCFVTASVMVTALFVFIIKRIGPQLRHYLPTPAQTAIVVLFGVCITVPRLIALGPDMPLAVYDDNWHYQKIVSIFSSFPDVSHYLFPELKLSYYFYGYVIPAAVYSMKTAINLKIIWVSYLFVVILALYMLIVTCFNTLLPRTHSARTLFALMITFLGGLHEWPGLIAAMIKGLPDWHTEWWAQSIGLDLQVSSLYTASFWAPQHICGLAVFALIVLLLNTSQRAWPYLLCGLLAGIQAGFSAYVALATVIYVLLWLVRPASGHFRARLVNAACFGAGCVLAIAPIAHCFIGRQDSIIFDPRISLTTEYLFFLFVEFGVLLILFGMYCVNRRNSSDSRTSFFVDAAFIAIVFTLLFCVKSSGFNVFSYRILLPVQVLLGLYAVLQLEQIKHRKGTLKIVIMALLGLQLTGFAPEMLAMAKKHYDVRISTIRLPKTVVTINQSRALTDVIAMPYTPDIDSVWIFNTLINNMFRQKNIDKRYFCKGTLDPNNLVYLNSEDTAILQTACATTQGAESLTTPEPPVTDQGKNY